MSSAHPHLELRDVSFGYGGGALFRNLSFAMAPGEIVALTGPSGQGKSTLLRLVAGLETPWEGSISLKGRVMSAAGHAVPPEKRGVGLVFQDLALFPHLSVAANIGFGLRSRGSLAAERQRVAELLGLFELEELAERRPQELSGGQSQRVAIARSLAPNPDLLMLDEPFSSLDDALRIRLVERLSDVFARTQMTVLFVTHHQDDAARLAHRIVDWSQLRCSR